MFYLWLGIVYTWPQSCEALDYSREPPVFARFGRISVGTNSRGWKGTRQSGSPPGAGQSRIASTRHAPIENEDDYDPACDTFSWLLDGALRAFQAVREPRPTSAGFNLTLSF